MSSEPLDAKRLRDLHERVGLPGSRGVPDLSPGEWADDVRVLLAEVARLERERDEARKWANTMEHERDWETQVVHSELLLRADDAEAALAVARKREQRLSDALVDISDGFSDSNNAGAALMQDIARAALVDEPAAGVDAAADEPGETPSATCPKCGEYMPLTLDGTKRIHGCHRTPPIGDLPYGLCACPVCGGYAPFRAGCWGTQDDPHEHAYMRPIHEVVRGGVSPSGKERGE